MISHDPNYRGNTIKLKSGLFAFREQIVGIEDVPRLRGKGFSIDDLYKHVHDGVTTHGVHQYKSTIYYYYADYIAYFIEGDSLYARSANVIRL